MNAKSLKQVNKVIAAKYPTVQLVRGNGYYYIHSEDEATALKIAGLYTSSIPVYGITQQTVEQWLRDVECLFSNGGEHEPILRPVPETKTIEVEVLEHTTNKFERAAKTAGLLLEIANARLSIYRKLIEFDYYPETAARIADSSLPTDEFGFKKLTPAEQSELMPLVDLILKNSERVYFINK